MSRGPFTLPGYDQWKTRSDADDWEDDEDRQLREEYERGYSAGHAAGWKFAMQRPRWAWISAWLRSLLPRRRKPIDIDTHIPF